MSCISGDWPGQVQVVPGVCALLHAVWLRPREGAHGHGGRQHVQGHTETCHVSTVPRNSSCKYHTRKLIM